MNVALVTARVERAQDGREVSMYIGGGLLVVILIIIILFLIF